VQEQRLGYWHKIGSVPAEDIVAVDETATWEGMERKVAWSLQGKKVYRYRQKNKGQKYTLIGAISVEGVVCHKIIKGSMKKQDFLEFVKTELCPKLNEKKVVIMDNLNSHKAIEVQQMISQTGARLLYLPVYSPEFNPIEMMWSVLKSFIRQFHDSPVKNIQSIIQASLLLINPSSFANWFAKCCYCTP
jgi:transposase